jgi:uncharacterized protein (TIGR02391 family)
MSLSRPIPKELFKKMILVVLNEHFIPDGAFSNNVWDIEDIAKNKIAMHFKLGELTDDEKGQSLRAAYELEQHGYIVQDPSQRNHVFKIIAEKGKELLQQPIEEMIFASVDVDQILKNSDLLTKVHDDYLTGDYDTCIFKAFKCLEEKVRAKAELPATAIGAELMSQAFRPGTGLLRHPEAATPAEEEGIHLLFRGAIMWFKNPSSHRTVGYFDPLEVAQALATSSLLLSLLRQCVKRS